MRSVSRMAPYFAFVAIVVGLLIFALVFGFKAMIFPATGFSLILAVVKAREEGIYSGLCYGTSVLLIFDSDAFVFTTFHLRIWYAYMILFWIQYLLDLVGGRIRFRPLGLIATLYYLLMSAVWLCIDTVDGKLSDIKYLLFTVGLVLLFRTAFRRLTTEATTRFLRWLFFYSLFLCTWGIVQYALRSSDAIQNIMFDYNNIRPSAFFSETTWYGIYCLLGVILVGYLVAMRELRAVSILAIIPFVVGIVLSASRSALLGLVLCAGGALLFYLIGSNRGKLRRTTVLLFVSLAVGAWLLYPIAKPSIDIILVKATLTDPSGAGRFEAYARSLIDLSSAGPFGLGFSWNPRDVTVTGTYLGAKSFALPFQVAHIFGWVGLALLAALVLHGLLANFRARPYGNEPKLAILLFAVFLMISMFTPIHQYPAGVLLAGVAVGLSASTRAKNNN